MARYPCDSSVPLLCWTARTLWVAPTWAISSSAISMRSISLEIKMMINLIFWPLTHSLLAIYCTCIRPSMLPRPSRRCWPLMRLILTMLVLWLYSIDVLRIFYSWLVSLCRCIKSTGISNTSICSTTVSLTLWTSSITLYRFLRFNPIMRWTQRMAPISQIICNPHHWTLWATSIWIIFTAWIIICLNTFSNYSCFISLSLVFSSWTPLPSLSNSYLVLRSLIRSVSAISLSLRWCCLFPREIWKLCRQVPLICLNWNWWPFFPPYTRQKYPLFPFFLRP